MIYEVSRPFQSSLVDSVYAAAAKHDLEVVLAGGTEHHSELACLRLLLAERCRGLIVTGSSLANRYLEEAGRIIPTLTLARYSSAHNVDSVYSDPVEGERMAVQHLYELGHRHIFHIGGVKRSMAPEREKGYLSAMSDSGLIDLAHVLQCGDDTEAGVRGADLLTTGDYLPTAVTCYNDAVASGVILRLRQYGFRIPQDISVVGYNDLTIAANPAFSLTTIRQDGYLLADKALELLAARLSSDPLAPSKEKTEIAVESRLVVRSSTGPVPEK